MANKLHDDYALYKGDEFLAIGTAYELAARFNVKPKTIYFYSTKANRNKDRGENRMFAVHLKDEVEDDYV